MRTGPAPEQTDAEHTDAEHTDAGPAMAGYRRMIEFRCNAPSICRCQALYHRSDRVEGLPR